MLPLCLTIDPGNTSAVALVEPAARPRLLRLAVFRGDADDWCDAAIEVFATMKREAGRREVVIRCEMMPPKADGWISANALSMRRGELRQAAWGGGFTIGGTVAIPGRTEPVKRWDLLMLSSWTSRLGVPPGKLGTGSTRGWHRLSEAERLVEMDPTTFRGLTGAVDGAEATLMGAALAWDLLGISAPKPEKPAKAPKARKPRAKAVA